MVPMISGYNNHIEGLMHIINAGIREAKIHLSKLLKHVKNGNEVILTDRGRPVGKIVPLKTEELSLEERIVIRLRNGWMKEAFICYLPLPTRRRVQ